LLLMRLAVGAVLVGRAAPTLWSDPSLHITLAATSLAAAGLVVAGLWTPVAGAVIAVLEMSQIVTADAHPVVCLLMATIAGALAMLGPGRWSIDARLFGWKRIDLPPRRH
jgi:putative oxidoreductase